MPVSRKAPAASGQFATPDITAAQVVAVVSAVAAQVVAWGWLSASASQQLVSIAGIVLPAVLAVVDSVIRHGRATGNASR